MDYTIDVERMPIVVIAVDMSDVRLLSVYHILHHFEEIVYCDHFKISLFPSFVYALWLFELLYVSGQLDSKKFTNLYPRLQNPISQGEH